MEIPKRPEPPGPPPSPSPSETWTAVTGALICPLGHSVPLDASFCPKCGKPVPAGTQLQAQESTRRLNENVGIGLIRNK